MMLLLSLKLEYHKRNRPPAFSRSYQHCYLISLVVQLVGSYQSRRTGTDDSHRLAITLRNLNMYIILREGVFTMAHSSSMVGGWS